MLSYLLKTTIPTHLQCSTIGVNLSKGITCLRYRMIGEMNVSRGPSPTMHLQCSTTGVMNVSKGMKNLRYRMTGEMNLSRGMNRTMHL